MDAVTIVLIALGVAALLGFVFLAFREITRNRRAAPKTPQSAAPAPCTVAKTRTIPAPEPEVAREEPEKEIVETSVRVSAPVAEENPAKPAPISASVPALTSVPEPPLDETLRTIGARLSIMPADFDRSAAMAVAQCSESDLDALEATGVFETDPESGRMSWIETSRVASSRLLSSEEAHAARLRHAEHFASMAVEATSPEVAEQAGAMPPLATEADQPHYETAFDFLAGSPGLERLLLQLVEAFARTGVLHREPREGIRWQSAALAAARGLHDRAAERDALNNLGGSYTDAAEHAHARECYEQATVINRELGDRLGEGRSLGNIGLACHRLGEVAKAVEWYETVLTIMREVGDRMREGLVLHSLGQAAADLGDHRKAISYFEQHLQIVVEAGDRRGESVVLASLATAHAALGEHRAALDLFERQLKLTEMIRDLPGEGVALGGMGRAQRQLGNPEKAVECFQRQVEVAHLLGDAAAGVVALGELGLAHEAATRTSKALECFDEQLKVARKIGDRQGEAHALWYAARAVRSRGQVADALTRASAALPLFVEIKSPETEKIRAEIEQWRAQV